MVFLYPGAIHIHSIHSDGTGTIEEIASAAKKAGLNWIVVTDHNNMNGKEGFYDGVCVIVEQEITPDGGNHYLAFGLDEPISSDLNPTEYIQKVKEKGGFGFVAHPDGKENRKNKYKSLRWIDWNLKDVGGIEIWNYMSNWIDYHDEKNPLNHMYAYLFRNNVLSGPSAKTLKWWDDLNNETQQIIPSIGGIDAHAFIVKWAFKKFKIFPYKNIFATLSNFVYLENSLPDDFEDQKNAILNALKLGKNLVMNRAWPRKNTDPSYYIQNKHRKAYSGDFVELDNSSRMFVELPLKADVKVIHNGNVILQKRTRSLEFDNLEKGKYRIEVHYKKRPWIFSNPILVK